MDCRARRPIIRASDSGGLQPSPGNQFYRNYGKEKRYSQTGDHGPGGAGIRRKNRKTGASCSSTGDETRRNHRRDGSASARGKPEANEWGRGYHKTGREEKTGDKGGESEASEVPDRGYRATRLFHRGTSPQAWVAWGRTFGLGGSRASIENRAPESHLQEAGDEEETGVAMTGAVRP